MYQTANDLRYIRRDRPQANTSLCKHHLPKQAISMAVLDITQCYIVLKWKAAVKETTSAAG